MMNLANVTLSGMDHGAVGKKLLHYFYCGS